MHSQEKHHCAKWRLPRLLYRWRTCGPRCGWHRKPSNPQRRRQGQTVRHSTTSSLRWPRTSRHSSVWLAPAACWTFGCLVSCMELFPTVPSYYMQWELGTKAIHPVFACLPDMNAHLRQAIENTIKTLAAEIDTHREAWCDHLDESTFLSV